MGTLLPVLWGGPPAAFSPRKVRAKGNGDDARSVGGGELCFVWGDWRFGSCKYVFWGFITGICGFSGGSALLNEVG